MTVSSVVYDADGITEYEDLAEAKAAQGTTWVRVNEGRNAEIDDVRDVFGIHPLAIEDIVNEVRPKVEEFSDYTLVIIKTAKLAGAEATFEEEVKTEAVGVIIGMDWVVTMSGGSDGPVERVWRAVVSGDERLLQRGPDFTAYRVLDVIIDEYFHLLDAIEDQIEIIEEEVVVSTQIETLEAINAVRRDLLSFRKTAWPAREALSILARGGPPQIQQPSEKYFRDVYDHLVAIVDLIETYRDLVVGTRDIYLNTLSQSTNEVMKVLTVVATIFLPLTFVVGVYGMNFADSRYNMPELGWSLGYPAVMAGMAVVALAMLVYFRQQDYL